MDMWNSAVIHFQQNNNNNNITTTTTTTNNNNNNNNKVNYFSSLTHLYLDEIEWNYFRKHIIVIEVWKEHNDFCYLLEVWNDMNEV